MEVVGRCEYRKMEARDIGLHLKDLSYSLNPGYPLVTNLKLTLCKPIDSGSIGVQKKN